MAKKRARKRIKKRKGKNIFRKILGLFIIISILAFGIYQVSVNGTVSKIAQENVARQNLQLGTFKPSETPDPPQDTPDAPSGEACSHDTGVPIVNSGKPVDENTCYCLAFLIDCKDKKCERVISYGGDTNTGIACNYGSGIPGLNGVSIPDMYCGAESLAGDGNGVFCIGKPVIYLYPEVPTLVDVKVETDGEIFVSDPLYPEGGWKNVLAEPSGKLTYEGKTYRELFYESNVKDIKKPLRGLTLDSSNIRNELDSIISRLGLIEDEKIEFLDYWIPRLKNLNSKYIFLGVIEKDEKDRIDKVIIEPKPDTFIEFIAYFSPLDKPYDGKKLELPSSPPKRIGFTAVEWGGTIGQ